MDQLTNYPLVMFAVTFAAMWLASEAGLWARKRRSPAGGDRSEDFDVITAALVSLLALTIGFTLSMAASRYEQRKIYEEGEANAIGTEILRVDLLPAAGGANVRGMLIAYLDQRILFFEHEDQHAQIDQRTDQLQAQLWSAVRGPAALEPTPVAAVIVTGMNDVFNARGYTHAALLNRIPPAAWVLLVTIALGCNALLGYGARDEKAWRRLAFVLPLAVSVSFLMIADIDAPQHGLIWVSPVNLELLAASLRR